MKRQIVFVREKPRMRIYKQAYGLAKIGRYELVLIASDYNQRFFEPVFDRIINYRSLFSRNNLLRKSLSKISVNAVSKLDLLNLEQIIQRLNPYVFHVHAEPNIIPATVMMKSNSPVIYDAQDLSGTRFGVEALEREERDAEKYCLENADGIVLKFDREILDFYRNIGYRIECPFLNYLDYCVSELFRDNRSNKEGEYELAYAGIVSPSFLSVEEEGNNQLLEIARKIIAQKIHFHIFTNPWSMGRKDAYMDYVELDNNNRYFHFHFDKPQGELHSMLCNYHFGCSIHDFSRTKRTKTFEGTAIGNKFSTYLEAGVPIIISRNLKTNTRYVERLGVGIGIELDELDKLYEILCNMDYEELKRNVVSVRMEKMNVMNNIHRLIEFYDRVAS